MKSGRIDETLGQTPDLTATTASRFSPAELLLRLDRVRGELERQSSDGLLVFSPENIFYLTGLDHQGFFSPHILIVPRNGDLHLVLRAMEAAAFQAQVKNAVFGGHPDDVTPGEKACEVIKNMGLARARLSIEKHSLFSPLALGETLYKGLPEVTWLDGSHLIDRLRMVKSEAELENIRKASRISAVMMQAARKGAAEGVSEAEIAAEVIKAMLRAGGDIPGFGPFIRATPSMPQEHVIWSDYRLRRGDMLFVELSGCYRRYHAPMGRLFFVGDLPKGTQTVSRICRDAFDAVVSAIKPGVTAGQVYQVWQDVVDEAGLAHYQRHHCGYMIGVGFPPSWVGGSSVIGLRRNSPMVLEAGMTFHLLSWLVGSGIGDYLLTDTAVLTESGCEALRQISTDPEVI